MAKEEKEKTFEENLENLEKIVKDLESGNIHLKFGGTPKEKLNSILNKDGKLEEFSIEE